MISLVINVTMLDVTSDLLRIMPLIVIKRMCLA